MLEAVVHALKNRMEGPYGAIPKTLIPQVREPEAGAWRSEDWGSTHKETPMPRGDKTAYTDKQKRKAKHIEEGYEKRGVSNDEAERRAWATVNKESGGGKKSGSGRGQEESKVSSKKGGKAGGAAAARRPAAARSASARKAAATRKANKSHKAKKAS